ncbi:MAG: SDR family NAD(P)-dependent oxidoreductase [Acidimicrobiales bacterium]
MTNSPKTNESKRGQTPTGLASKYGPWALITGASSGIGAEFAKRIAADGVNVVIAARRIDRLESLAEELRTIHGVAVRPVQADLSSVEGIDAIEKAVADVDLAIVVNNAGSASPGAFLKNDVESQLNTIRLNVSAPVEIAHLLGERLINRGRGAMIFTGSTSAFAGVATLANYAASKAFVGTFAEGLNREWGKQGVDVLVVHPGPTRTEMVEMDGVDFGAVPMNWMTPEKVADKAVGSLGRKAVLIPGAMNKIQRFVFTRLLPRRATSAVWSALMGRVTDESLR